MVCPVLVISKFTTCDRLVDLFEYNFIDLFFVNIRLKIMCLKMRIRLIKKVGSH